MTKQTNAVGAYGERVAVRLLAAKGLQIIKTNCVTPEGELDIIALDRDTVVFCEVKTRRSRAFGRPVEAVTRAKVRRLRAAALWWLHEKRHEFRRPWVDLRFDVVSVLVPRKGKPEAEHLERAF